MTSYARLDRWRVKPADAAGLHGGALHLDLEQSAAEGDLLDADAKAPG